MSATCAIQFNHVGISVPDAEAAVEWYTTVFGMTVTRTTQCVEPDPDKGDETPMHKRRWTPVMFIGAIFHLVS